MDSGERRSAILACLGQADKPLSATALARQFSVSRQVVVGDVALLRAAGAAVAATPRGYLIPRQEEGRLYTVVCHHTPADLERELCLMVDNGCTVVDVAVEHPVYGLLTGALRIASRYDVSAFMGRVRASDAAPLSALTGGVHLHTLRCPDEAAFRRARKALGDAGFLLEE